MEFEPGTFDASMLNIIRSEYGFRYVALLQCSKTLETFSVYMLKLMLHLTVIFIRRVRDVSIFLYLKITSNLCFKDHLLL